tara:strand:- start:37409 stop:37852 length:444 start_codon:yes stop_codon:yes gene_type:complete
MKTRTFLMLICLFVANNILAQTTTSVSHKYDAFNRLKESSDGINTTVYEYDKLGNRTQQSISVTLSVSENEILGLKLFPNPTLDKVSIVSKNIIDKVKIYDVAGRLVKEVKNNKNSIEIDISSLSVGVYSFSIYALGKKQSAKVLKK